ncbi:glutathione S-transferase family protein [Altererythrobacter sp. Root672]|uniref:glutathione S-transferase family protein n=1 Tax=Altererythrobacter sp. Root672 TaxID=1736584 RepID=UPI0006FE32F5|nr:glutathione S-transferase family protein [Altererythrobacter sp. Root672]KRA83854.1 glutathione S-transferase [Altererythrobacter sp. Root672]
MAEYTFFFNPMSRAQIARWALHEANADYEPVLVDWDNKPQALLKANPMGKLPTIIHHHNGHDHAVSEAAAVCHYLAEMSAPDLLPRQEEKADYFRWLFFAAGPVEQSVTAKSMGWEEGDRQRMVGFGSYDLTMDALDGWLSTHDYVCGNRFTMADVYVGSQVMWGLRFGSMPDRASFKAYWDRCSQRPAYQEGSAIDMALIVEMQGATKTEA